MPEWLEKIEHEEEDMHAHGVGGDLTSAVLGIIKGMVGPAILYLPHGLANTGWALAFPMMAVTTCMFLYSSQCLLDTWRLEHDKMKQRMERRFSHGTPATTENGTEGQPLIENVQRYKMIFLSYPELAYRALGEKGERAIKVGIALMQSGVCLVSFPLSYL
jgi:proton-coupled amino acid transporter